MVREVRAYGFLSAIYETHEDSEDTMTFEYGGNMGNNMASVNRCLKGLGYAPVDIWKKNFPNYVEDGSPDYLYTITFQLEGGL